LPYTIHRDQAALPDITVYGDLANQTYRNRQFAPAPLYLFGDGRGFSVFTYSSLKLSPAAPSVCDSITVTVDVTNTGAVAADEVVQIYARCPCDSASDCEAGTCAAAALSTPPSTALIGFTRQTIAGGAKQTVTIEIRTRDLASYREEDMVEVLRPGKLWLTVGGGQLGSTTTSPVLQARVAIGGAETALSDCAPRSVPE
jgi:beta-glucosidase